MKFSTTTMVYIFAGILAIGAGYYVFFSGPAQVLPVTADSTTDPAVAQFLGLIAELGPIHFDTAFFTDPRFLGLTDITTPVSSEPLNRHDFFAAIGSQ